MGCRGTVACQGRLSTTRSIQCQKITAKENDEQRESNLYPHRASPRLGISRQYSSAGKRSPFSHPAHKRVNGRRQYGSRASGTSAGTQRSTVVRKSLYGPAPSVSCPSLSTPACDSCSLVFPGEAYSPAHTAIAGLGRSARRSLAGSSCARL